MAESGKGSNKLADRDRNENDKRNQEGSNQNNGSKDANLTAQEIYKIRTLVVDFWKSFGKDNDVEKWQDNIKAKEVIKYFNSDKRNDSYFSDCDEYLQCREKLKLPNKTNDNDWGFDEASVDFKRFNTIKKVVDLLNLACVFSKNFISNMNRHAIGYIKSMINKGESYNKIAEKARNNLGENTSAQQGQGDENGGSENGNGNGKSVELLGVKMPNWLVSLIRGRNNVNNPEEQHNKEVKQPNNNGQNIQSNNGQGEEKGAQMGDESDS